MPHVTLYALEEKLAGRQSGLIDELTTAVLSLYGEWAQRISRRQTRRHICRGGWALGGVAVTTTAPRSPWTTRGSFRERRRRPCRRTTGLRVQRRRRCHIRRLCSCEVCRPAHLAVRAGRVRHQRWSSWRVVRFTDLARQRLSAACGRGVDMRNGSSVNVVRFPGRVGGERGHGHHSVRRMR